MTSQSPDFKRDMFEYPLSECTFQVSGDQPLFPSCRSKFWYHISSSRFLLLCDGQTVSFFLAIGLCDWFQLALPEHSDDSHVCWNPKLTRPWECGCVAVCCHEGEASSHSSHIRVHPNPNSRYSHPSSAVVKTELTKYSYYGIVVLFYTVYFADITQEYMTELVFNKEKAIDCWCVIVTCV